MLRVAIEILLSLIAEQTWIRVNKTSTANKVIISLINLHIS